MAEKRKSMFIVKGPYKVPTINRGSGKMVAEDLAGFWDSAKSHKTNIGCYVFAIRAGRGITPLYVGKTIRCFEKECFTPHKVNHYNYALAKYVKGTPIMFFIEYNRKQGKANISDISELENFLIQVGRRINPDLRNIKGAKEPTWGIKGVIRGGKGKKSESEKQFCRLFDLCG